MFIFVALSIPVWSPRHGLVSFDTSAILSSSPVIPSVSPSDSLVRRLHLSVATLAPKTSILSVRRRQVRGMLLALQIALLQHGNLFTTIEILSLAIQQLQQYFNNIVEQTISQLEREHKALREKSKELEANVPKLEKHNSSLGRSVRWLRSTIERRAKTPMQDAVVLQLVPR